VIIKGTIDPGSTGPVQLYTVVPAKSFITFPFTLKCVLIWDNPLHSYQVDHSSTYPFLSTYSGPGSVIMTGNTKVSKIVSSPQKAHKQIRAREAFSDNASDKSHA